MKNMLRNTALFVIGAVIYFEIELHWRYFTNHLPVHWTMPILGAYLFVVIGGINEWLPWDMSFIIQSIIGMISVTVAEFVSGCILNIYLGLNVWDYSHLPLNILGQVCVPFMIVWFILSAIAIVLDDFIRWKLFNEEFPHYRL